MFDNLLRRNERLRQRIDTLLVEQGSGLPPTPTVLITPNEINARHGTGVLVSKIFGDTPDLVTIRTRNDYEAEQNFGAHSFCLPHTRFSRPEIFAIINKWLAGVVGVQRIVCVPYYAEDVLVALAVKEIFDAPLCTYIMDDNNIHAYAIPENLMQEVLAKSDLRLAISAEMRQAYESRYRHKFWLLPPVVSDELILANVNLPVTKKADAASSGVMIGNIWAQNSLELLRRTIRGSGTQLHWYCNNGKAPVWTDIKVEELAADGIMMHAGLPEAEMAAVLRESAFAVMPSGTLDRKDDQAAIAHLSLPSRVPFIMSTSHTPIIVIGNRQTASARFVERFQIGTVCDYETTSYTQAVERVTETETQRAMRTRACRLAPTFAASGAADWLWKTLEQGIPPDMKYERLMPPPADEFAYYVEPPVPQGVIVDFAPTFRALRRLQVKGFAPDFVVDIGASTGIWSQIVKKVFPAARFILVDAVASRYNGGNGNGNHALERAGFEMVEAAVSDREGRVSFQVASDLYNSSLIMINEIVKLQDVVEVRMMTLDHLAESKAIKGRGLLKMDVQYAEHLIIKGGARFIAEQVDAVVMELTLTRPVAEARTFLEMIVMMDELGFRYCEDVGEWRRPTDGTLEQKDVLFVRHALFL
jgi:FkbM family methyltransferase